MKRHAWLCHFCVHQVKREHDPSGRDVELFRTHLYGGETVGPTVKGTPGAALVEGLEPLPQECVLVKYRFSAFFDTNLDRVLRRHGVVNVVVAGSHQSCLPLQMCVCVLFCFCHKQQQQR